jgi:hypothetical protein
VKSEKLHALPPPLMVTPGVVEPGCAPSIVTFVATVSVDARSIVVTDGSKTIVSPGRAIASS